MAPPSAPPTVAPPLPTPPALTDLEAAAIPETYFTVWTNVFDRGGLRAGSDHPDGTGEQASLTADFFRERDLVSGADRNLGSRRKAA